jgi:hypothetical protein
VNPEAFNLRRPFHLLCTFAVDVFLEEIPHLLVRVPHDGYFLVNGSKAYGRAFFPLRSYVGVIIATGNWLRFFVIPNRVERDRRKF